MRKPKTPGNYGTCNQMDPSWPILFIIRASKIDICPKLGQVITIRDTTLITMAQEDK